MNPEKKARLQAAGLQLDSALRRFMNNEAMVEKYLNRFLSEKSYAELKEALAANDAEKAAMAAHTLKSVCGTLGFVKMQEQVIDEEALIKGGKMAEAIAKAPEIEEEYQRICSLIRE